MNARSPIPGLEALLVPAVTTLVLGPLPTNPRPVPLIRVSPDAFPHPGLRALPHRLPFRAAAFRQAILFPPRSPRPGRNDYDEALPPSELARAPASDPHPLDLAAYPPGPTYWRLAAYLADEVRRVLAAGKGSSHGRLVLVVKDFIDQGVPVPMVATWYDLFLARRFAVEGHWREMTPASWERRRAALPWAHHPTVDHWNLLMLRKLA
jgi:hypothetical protein